MQSFWRNYKDGVLLAFILATGLGVLYDHGVSGQESVLPTPGLGEAEVWYGHIPFVHEGSVWQLEQFQFLLD